MPPKTIRNDQNVDPDKLPGEVDAAISDARHNLSQPANFVLLIVGTHIHGDVFPGAIGDGDHHEQEVYLVGPTCGLVTSLLKTMDGNQLFCSMILTAAGMYMDRLTGGQGYDRL